MPGPESTTASPAVAAQVPASTIASPAAAAPGDDGTVTSPTAAWPGPGAAIAPLVTGTATPLVTGEPVSPAVDEPAAAPPRLGTPAPASPGAARRRRTDGFAVAALICGILALVPLALAAGLAGLARTRQGRRGGRGAAVAGVVLAAAWTAAGAGVTGALLAFGARPTPAPHPLRGTVFSLRTGQCATTARNGVTGAHAVPCGQPHEVEIYATYRLASGPWPGAAALSERARQGCLDRMASYLDPQLVGGTSLTGSYVYPDHATWATGERMVICEIRAASGNLTGSVRGLGQSAG